MFAFDGWVRGLWVVCYCRCSCLVIVNSVDVAVLFGIWFWVTFVCRLVCRFDLLACMDACRVGLLVYCLRWFVWFMLVGSWLVGCAFGACCVAVGCVFVSCLIWFVLWLCLW